MIEIQDIQKSYQSKTVLDIARLRLEAGQSIALIGPNGSGKTTLIKIILGLVIPDQGTVLVNNVSTNKSEQYRRDIGYMPQISQFPAQLKVKQLFELMRSLRSDIPTEELDQSLYDAFAIERMEEKRLGALSGGMTQQVSAALAFYFSPGILILDEPTAALDPMSNEILKDKIRQVTSEGRTVLTTSHILNDLEEICNQVVYLMDGKVLFNDTLTQLSAQTSEVKLNKMIVRLMEKTGGDE